MEDQEKFLIRSGGGFGYHIALTRALKAFRDAHRKAKIHVQVEYQDAVNRLPFIDRFYVGNPAYFAEEHVDFEIISMIPYERLAFRRGHEHLVDAMCAKLGVPSPAEDDRAGFIRLSDEEHEMAVRLTSRMDRSKKWVAFQPFGGTPFYNVMEALNITRAKQVRDLPMDTAQEFVTALKKSNCEVIQISLPTEKQLDGAQRWDWGTDQNSQPKTADGRTWFALLNLCDMFIGIDSFAMHAWAALQRDRTKPKKGVVLWGGTGPGSFGYKGIDALEHKGEDGEPVCPTPHCGRPMNAMPDYRGANAAWTCKHEGDCMRFTVEEMMKALGIEKPKDEPKAKDLSKHGKAEDKDKDKDKEAGKETKEDVADKPVEDAKDV